MKRLNRKLNESSSAVRLVNMVEQYGNTCRKMGFMQGSGDKGNQKYAKLKSEELLDDIKEYPDLSTSSYAALCRELYPKLEADFRDCLLDMVKEYGNTCRAFGFMQGRAKRLGQWEEPPSGLQRKKQELFDGIIELVSVYKHTGKVKFGESGSEEGETEWFDRTGDMKKHLPMDCILDCSGGGRVDDQVAYWVNELNFHVPTEKGLSYLQEYGLDDIEPEDVDKYVLWMICGNIKDEAYEFCRGGMDYDDFETSEYPDDIDDWTEQDWDNFQSEVAICQLGI